MAAVGDQGDAGVDRGEFWGSVVGLVGGLVGVLGVGVWGGLGVVTEVARGGR